MLNSADFALELVIFERGVPPEFRAWVTRNGRAIPPTDVELRVRLTRLGGHVDEISFSPNAEFLRGNTVIYEPHSFEVAIEAVHAGATFNWQYDNCDGIT